MSDEHNKELHDQGRSTMYSSSLSYDSQACDPSSYMSLTECLQIGALDYNSLATSFGLSEVLISSADQQGNTQKPSSGDIADCGVAGAGGETPLLTQNSSLSSSSSEPGAEEDSGKNTVVDDHNRAKGEEEAEKSKKGTKGKKKGAKKEKELRFAFMTKSEVDQLEDGYRWRKYGQKAVKNSPYPRSYYRCTTQKCTVKKRVERSFEDPTTVITTYEGQHNHPVPSSLRGNYNSAPMFTPSSSSSSSTSSSSSFLSPLMMVPTLPLPHHQDLLLLHGASNNMNNNSVYYSHNYANPNSVHQYRHHNYHHQLPLPDQHHDNGLLQDLIPSSMFFKQEPRE